MRLFWQSIVLSVVKKTMTKEQIKQLIADRGYQSILQDHNLTLWKTLEILDELGYIFLERYEEDES